jgi:hypothetical protein
MEIGDIVRLLEAWEKSQNEQQAADEIQPTGRRKAGIGPERFRAIIPPQRLKESPLTGLGIK